MELELIAQSGAQFRRLALLLNSMPKMWFKSWKKFEYLFCINFSFRTRNLGAKVPIYEFLLIYSVSDSLQWADEFRGPSHWSKWATYQYHLSRRRTSIFARLSTLVATNFHLDEILQWCNIYLLKCDWEPTMLTKHNAKTMNDTIGLYVQITLL